MKALFSKIFHKLTNDKFKIKPFSYNTPVLLMGVFFIVAFSSCLAWMQGWVGLEKPDDVTVRDYILLFSVLSVGIGWVVSVYNSTKSQRKQHTINVLISHLKDPINRECMLTFNKAYPFDNDSIVIEQSDIDNFKKFNKLHREYNILLKNDEDTSLTDEQIKKVEENRKLQESIRRLLNEYEFIAAAIRRHDLDYDLMKDIIRGSVCTLYRTCDLLIKDYREEPGVQGGTTKYPKTYEHLIELYEDWSKADC